MLFFEDVGLGVNLQRRLRQPEAARQRADRHQHGAGMRVLGAFDRNGDDFVLLQDLDRPLGATVRCRRRTARCRRGARACTDLGDPVGTRPRNSIAGWQDTLAGVRLRQRELFETRRAGTRSSISSQRRRDSSGGAADDMAAARCIAEARFELVADLARLLLDLFVLGHDDVEAVRRARKSSTGTSSLVVVEPFAHRNDNELIGRAGGSLRRRVEPAQRLDHVADELDAHRFGSRRGKYVDDAAANREGAVLVYGILTSEARVDEQVGESLGLDLRCPN